MNNPGVNVEEMVFPVIGGENMGGTAMRDMIAADHKAMFISKLPKHLNVKDKEYAWKSLTFIPNRSFNNIVDNQIDEMSSMAGGAVEMGVGAFGSGATNSYNPYSKKKNKKPKVKRAKRQRRR